MDVYLQRKPAAPALGMVLSLVALAVATALAADLTKRRAGLPDRATRLQPLGWPVSIQPPMGWQSSSKSTDGNVINTLEFVPKDLLRMPMTVSVGFEVLAGDIQPFQALDIQQQQEGLSEILKFFMHATPASLPRHQRVGELEGASRTWILNNIHTTIIVGVLSLSDGNTGVITITAKSQDGSAGRATALANFFADSVQVMDEIGQ